MVYSYELTSLFSIRVSLFDFCEIELWSRCRVVEGLQMMEKNQDVMTDQVDTRARRRHF